MFPINIDNNVKALYIKNYYIKRRLSEMAQAVLRACYADAYKNVDEIIEISHKSLIEIGATGKSKNDYYNLQPVVQSLIDKVSYLYHQFNLLAI